MWLREIIKSTVSGITNVTNTVLMYMYVYTIHMFVPESGYHVQGPTKKPDDF